MHPLEHAPPPAVRIRDSNGVIREVRQVSLRLKHAALDVVKLVPKDNFLALGAADDGGGVGGADASLGMAGPRR